MNDDKIIHPSDDLVDGVYSNIEDHKIQYEKTNHNSLYTFSDIKVQISSDLEDPNGADDWKSTNSHKCKLVIAYNTNAGTIHYA